MEVIDRLLGAQIRQPSGVIGWLLGHLMAHEHQPLTEWTFELMRVDAGDRLLDIGCGGGMALGAASRRAPRGAVTGMDYSGAMVREARARNRRLIASGRVAIVHANIASMPFAVASFDKAFAIETFYFWPNPKSDLEGVRNVLRPGGRLALAMDTSKDGTRHEQNLASARRLNMTLYSGTELEALLVEAGFTAVQVESVPSRGRGWICAIGTRPEEARSSAGAAAPRD